MKLPKHLEERRYDRAQALAEELFHAGPEQAFKDGYDLAVADMLEEIAPLVEGAKEYVASNFECRDAKLINAFRSWQKKFGGKG
jgi:hypothetical protein